MGHQTPDLPGSEVPVFFYACRMADGQLQRIFLDNPAP